MRVNHSRRIVAPARPSILPWSALRGRSQTVESRFRLLARLGRADRWAFDRVAAARLRGLEYVLPRLSRFADHGVLWFTAAGALGLTGRPRLRRAALRGSVAVAVASPVVNLVGKQAFRRKRPVVDLVPPIRIRWKLPTSHAFPSGHSASAAAFATGVALEAPGAVAAPIAATAAAVAFARVYTGAHYPGDVLAGLGIGALAAAGTRLVWPARPPAARVPAALAAADGEGLVSVDPAPGAAGDGADAVDAYRGGRLGRADIRVIAAGRRVPRLRAVAAVLAGHLRVIPGSRAWRVTGLEVVSPSGGLRPARDGEVSALPAAVRFGKHVGALLVFVPGDAGRGRDGHGGGAR